MAGIIASNTPVRELPKFADFGAIGTMRYMAPEQLRGHEVDPGWDLWALTVIAYEMLTGTNPFAGATTAECYRNKPG